MNIDDKLKIAFLGGAINSAAGSAHYAAVRLNDNLELVAGCFSRHEEINLQTANTYHVSSARVYTSLEELIKNEKSQIDAIVLLTPTDQHAQQVIICLEHDIPVICEKALACDTKEAEVIRDVLKKKKGFLKVIYNYLGYPIIRELKHMINNNKFGRLHHIQIEMPQEGFNRIDLEEHPVVPQIWRLHDGMIPTISLDLSVHLHMIIKYLTGELPIAVVAVSQSYGNFSTVKDNISAIIEYSNTISCNMWYSKIANGNRNGLSIRIFGETGSAEWVQENPEYLNMADSHGNKWIFDRGNSNAVICNQPRYARFKAGHPAGFVEAFANYYYDISVALLEFKYHTKNINAECFGIEEAIEGLVLLEAIAISSDSKRWEECLLTEKSEV